MKNKWTKMIIWVAAIALVASGATYGVVRAVNAPLAPALTVPTATPSTSVQQGSCGETGSMLVLFIGQDINSLNPPYGADLVRVLKLDFATNQITYVGFPRDMLVDTPDLADVSITQDRLGSTYFSAFNNASGEPKDKAAAAADILANTLYSNFGVRPDHYFVMDANTIAKAVDKLGGVDVDLPAAVTLKGVDFPAGAQTLSGSKATVFVTANDDNDELARMQRQELFMDAVNRKASKLGWLSDVPSLFNDFSGGFVTDLSMQQLIDVGCLGNKEANEPVYKELTDAAFYTTSDLPIAITGDTSSAPILVPNKDAIRTYLADLFK